MGSHVVGSTPRIPTRYWGPEITDTTALLEDVRHMRCPVCVKDFHPDVIWHHVNQCLDRAREAALCVICDSAFESVEALDLHVAGDHEILPFECPICFDSKTVPAIALCCDQELCAVCAQQPLRRCPFCRVAPWQWIVPVAGTQNRGTGNTDHLLQPFRSHLLPPPVVL